MQLVALPRANRRNEPSRPRSITRVYATTHTPARTFTFTPAAAFPTERAPTLRFPPLSKPERSTGPPPLTAPPPTRLLHPLFSSMPPPPDAKATPVHYTLQRHIHAYRRIRTRATSVHARTHARTHTGAAAVRGGRTNAETRPQGMGTCNCVNGTMADGPSLESPAVETRF